MTAHPIRDGQYRPAEESTTGDTLPGFLDRHAGHDAGEGPDTFADVGDPHDNLAGLRGPDYAAGYDLTLFARTVIAEAIRVEQRRPNDASTYTRTIDGRSRIAMRDAGRNKLGITNTGTVSVLLGFGNDAPCLVPLAVGAWYVHEGMAEVWAESATPGTAATVVAVSERYLDA